MPKLNVLKSKTQLINRKGNFVGLLVAITVLAGVGVAYVAGSQASGGQTTTFSFLDASSVNPAPYSSGVSTVTDKMGLKTLPVTQVAPGGSISYGGAGGSGGPVELSFQSCVVMRTLGAKASVTITGWSVANRKPLKRTVLVKAVPGGLPYWQTECVDDSNGTIVPGTPPAFDVKNLSTETINVYQAQALTTWRY